MSLNKIFLKYDFLNIYKDSILNKKYIIKGKIFSYELTIDYFTDLLQKLLKSNYLLFKDFIKNHLELLFDKKLKKINHILSIIFSLEKYLNRSLFLVIIESILINEFDIIMLRKLNRINKILKFEEKKNLYKKFENWDNYIININTLYIILLEKFNLNENDISIINSELKKFILKNRKIINNNKITYNLKNINFSITIFILLKLYKNNKLSNSLINNKVNILKDIEYYKIIWNNLFSFNKIFNKYLNKIKLIENSIFNNKFLNKNDKINNYIISNPYEFYNDILKIKNKDIFNNYSKYEFIINNLLENNLFLKLNNYDNVYRLLFKNKIFSKTYLNPKKLINNTIKNDIINNNKNIFISKLFIKEFNELKNNLNSNDIILKRYKDLFKNDNINKLNNNNIRLLQQSIRNIINNYDKSLILSKIKNKINKINIDNKNLYNKIINILKNSKPNNKENIDLKNYLKTQKFNLINNLKLEIYNLDKNINEKNLLYHNILKNIINQIKNNSHNNIDCDNEINLKDSVLKFELFENIINKNLFNFSNLLKNNNINEINEYLKNNIDELINLEKNKNLKNNINKFENSEKEELFSNKSKSFSYNNKLKEGIKKEELYSSNKSKSFKDKNKLNESIEKEELFSNKSKKFTYNSKLKEYIKKEELCSINKSKSFKNNNKSKENIEKINLCSNKSLSSKSSFKDENKRNNKLKKSFYFNNKKSNLNINSNKNKMKKIVSFNNKKNIKNSKKLENSKHDSWVNQILVSDPKIKNKKKENLKSIIPDLYEKNIKLEEMRKRIRTLESKLDKKDRIINSFNHKKTSKSVTSKKNIKKKLNFGKKIIEMVKKVIN